MSKLDEFRRTSVANVAESMGGGGAGPGIIPGEFRPPMPAVSAKLRGVRRRADVSDIPVSKIGRDDDQPRKAFDRPALERLAESLRTRGQLQPIRVRWVEPRGEYVVVLGERRWQAAQIAGLSTLACVVVDGDVPPDELRAIQVIENCLREDLLPIEQARAFEAMMRDHGWTQADLAKELNITQSAVAKALATLTLPAEVQGMVDDGKLDQSKAYEVSRLADPVSQTEVAARVVSEGLTRDQTAEVVRRRRERVAAGKPGGKGGGGVKGKQKFPKEVAIRVTPGRKVTVSDAKGIDPQGVVDALRVALARAEAATRPAREEAA
jgi:ParB family transcriptional regulator, chromosome partitioning protein